MTGTSDTLTIHISRPDGLTDAEWEACKEDISTTCLPLAHGLLYAYRGAAKGRAS